MHTITVPFRRSEPRSFESLALIPLFPVRKPQIDYVGLDEGLARGLRVTEIDDAGSVATLFVDNPTPLNVLVYEGEELVGAKQNRIPDRAIVVQAQSKLPIPVSCVERGRWAYRSAAFSAAPRAAYPALRKQKHLGGSQAHVWQEVAAKSERLAAFSPTDAAEEMYVQRGATLEQYVAALPRQDGQCGAIVCIAGRVVCLDFVGRSDVYAGLYAKLLRGTRSTRSSSRRRRPCRRRTRRSCWRGSRAPRACRRSWSASASSGGSTVRASPARSSSWATRRSR